jgi:hypothetical protein
MRNRNPFDKIYIDNTYTNKISLRAQGSVLYISNLQNNAGIVQGYCLLK